MAGVIDRRLGAKLLAGAAAVALATAGQPAGAAEKQVPHTEVYWGDVHLHTNFSLDAYATGNTSVTPDMAYRFARGIPIKEPGLDRKIQIRRPLDFLAVTDHAVFMGLQVFLSRKDALFTSTPWGQKMIEAFEKGQNIMAASGGASAPDTPEQREKRNQIFSDKIRQTVWDEEVDAAQKNYVPGKFTTLVGWEWTAVAYNGEKTVRNMLNLHRNVITNADGKTGKSFFPYSNMDSNRPEDLWAWMARTKKRTGIDMFAIPHNSNLSGGRMFALTDSDGKAITPEYARMRAAWEPLVEITQTKGTSEVRPELALDDEFAEFEIRRKLLAGTPTPPDAGDYVRSALVRGIKLKTQIGVNPFKFGVIGSTDIHTGMSNVTEGDFTGKLVMDIPLSQHYKPDRPVIFPDWEMSASGRAAVWATSNTRQSIFDAMKRKEVYGTTGTRIRLRVFGGFNFVASDAEAKNLADIGYRKGIPMGGDLTAAPAGKSPEFLIHAVKDPLSGNLDRVQVIKGWVDGKGGTHTKIYDVAWSGNRKKGPDGKVPAVGNTVDLSTGLYTNTIGAVQLSTVWKDPAFNPKETAFYYVRVIEIPTPRHSLLDAIALGIPVSETKEPATIQERAYSSPIWYNPTT
jgi:hypothetical protein